MLRDIPYIASIMALLIGMALLGTMFFVTDNQEDKAVTALNTLTRTAAINHVDMTSRVDIGHMYLNQNGEAMIVDDPKVGKDGDFESDVLTVMGSKLSDDSVVRFDYITRTGSREIPVSVYTYKKGKWTLTTADNKSNWRRMTARESLEAVRVQVRETGDTSNKNVKNLDDPDYWTYQSTVKVDRSDFVTDLMEAAQN